jgi:hypothetical protein
MKILIRKLVSLAREQGRKEGYEQNFASVVLVLMKPRT